MRRLGGSAHDASADAALDAELELRKELRAMQHALDLQRQAAAAAELNLAELRQAAQRERGSVAKLKALLRSARDALGEQRAVIEEQMRLLVAGAAGAAGAETPAPRPARAEDAAATEAPRGGRAARAPPPSSLHAWQQTAMTPMTASPAPRQRGRAMSMTVEWRESAVRG